MKRKDNRCRNAIRLFFFFMMSTVLWASCTHTPKELVPSADFAPYVNAYTGGIISQSSTIRIELTNEQPMVELNAELKENPFTFSPSLKGKTCWVSNNTIEFVPDEGVLKPGTLYEGTFQLGNFVRVDKKLEKFKFSFRVQERDFSWVLKPLSVSVAHPDTAVVEGELFFSAAMQKEEVEKMLSATGEKGKKQYSVEVALTNNPARYSFRVRRVAREAADYALTLTADGASVGIDRTQSEEMTIPAKDSFRFLSAARIDQPESGMEVVFSDPLSDTQDLKGLIEIPEIPRAVFQVKDNRALLYFDVNSPGKLTLNIHKGVKNYRGLALGTDHSIAYSEPNLKPQVELAAEAAILPDVKSLVIPFRAVNLYAVDVRVIRIFESNVLMFMQNNTLASSNELRRAGRLVHTETLWLNRDPAKNIHQWNDYSIDLARLIRQEPGAIYRVQLSFRQEYSAYPCGGSENTEKTFADEGMTRLRAKGVSEEEEAEWDLPSTYYYYNGGQVDWSLYDWRERNNPCHPTYYMGAGNSVSCNVFASNLGMIVKSNSSHRLWIAVDNLLDTEPVKKAKVTAYNFQLQPIGEGETNSEGVVEITPQGIPFIVVAEADKQKAYVRVVDGEEQSVSRFDTGGKEVQKGLKGFVYGERGVWRPGDTLHISFILEDREKRIPDKHPVSLEIYNPRGQFYAKMVSTHGLNGFYTFEVPTQADDPTGVWNAYVKVGGTAFHKGLRIETIKPNRLKINLALPQVLRASDRTVYVPLLASWLTGATASHLKTSVEMRLSKAHTQFKRYGQYLFNNPATDFSTLQQEMFKGTLDETGKAGVTLQLPAASNAPGMLNATFTTRVFEPGGDASIYTQTVPFSPFSAYVGINLNQPKGKYIETDKDHVFDLVTVNEQGEPVSRSRLEYKLYRFDWSWWWEHGDDSSSAYYTYVNNSSMTPVASGNLQTDAEGKASFKFRVNYPEWGRYLVYVKDKESGHATGGTVYVDWPEWRGRSAKKDPSGIKMLAFSLDKDSYEIGEKVTAILPAAAGGRALVSIESGSTVLHQEWIKVSPDRDTQYTFEVTPEMAPNVYLHISLLQPHAQTVNDLPLRMYGVVPVFVTNRQTLLQPQIQMPATLRPETDFQVTVSEKSGKPMTYTLAIVDDGLLDLTGFKTPDPWNEFYSREALGVRTWDMYDHVLGAWTGSYHPLFSIGGDAALKPADEKANRFKPVVKFIGPFYLGKGKRQTHTLRLPMYVGSLRAMVVAGQDGAYGKAEKSVYVRTPLMMLSTLPRVLSVNEEITVPVNVFAMEQQVKQVDVSIQSSGAGVQRVGAARQVLTFDRPGDQLAFFRLKTGNKTGKAIVRLVASGGGKQTQETLEIEVRNPNPTVTLHESRWLERGESGELSYRLDASSAHNRVELEVSRIPPVDFSRRFDFLYNYQHHCTEQLVSKALPLLFIHCFRPVEASESESIKKNVQEAVRKIYARQLPNGGFAGWPGNAVADEWVTSYAGMFLTQAQEQGYAVSANVWNRWKRFQRAAAQNWRVAPPDSSGNVLWQSELQQAFRLYTLALAGVPEQGAMNRMKEQPHLSLQARWSLAAAYALTGKMKSAEELAFNAATTVAPYRLTNAVYGSSDRDEAMILETLLLMNRERAALQQAQVVSRNLAKQDVFDTQSTAFALMAMARLAEKVSGMLDFTWNWNGKAQPAVKSAQAVFCKAWTLLPSRGTVSVKNRGEGALCMDLSVCTQLLNDTLPALSNNLRMDIRYANMDGTSLAVNDIRQGTDFTATVSVSHTGTTTDYTHLALTHILPSGWEIYDDKAADQSSYTYREVRDDRVLTYFDLRRGETKTFTIRLQAAYLGDYILPAVQCEAMYDSRVLARSRAGRTLVSR